MSSVPHHRLARSFAPPRYLAPPLAGIDISTSGIKAVRVAKRSCGLVLEQYADIPFPPQTFASGEVLDRAAVVKALVTAAHALNIQSANVALPESKSYLFDTTVTGENEEQWRLNIEQRLGELVPLPPAMTVFDLIEVGRTTKNETQVVGVGFAKRVVDDALALTDEAGLTVSALEAESFAMVRALLPEHNKSTVLMIDMGKTTTKIGIVSQGTPRFATTVDVGGQAITQAIQKYFGITEVEAKKVKAEQGIVPAQGNEELLSAMLSTVSVIRDEITARLEYWQSKSAPGGAHEPVSRAILVGGNASIRGFQEYLESSLRIPVTTGNVFTNFASPDAWLPPLEYNESLAFATAIGLALRDLQIP